MCLIELEISTAPCLGCCRDKVDCLYKSKQVNLNLGMKSLVSLGSRVISWLPIVTIYGLKRSRSVRNQTVVLGSANSGNKAAFILIRIRSWFVMYCDNAMLGSKLLVLQVVSGICVRRHL